MTKQSPRKQSPRKQSSRTKSPRKHLKMDIIPGENYIDKYKREKENDTKIMKSFSKSVRDEYFKQSREYSYSNNGGTPYSDLDINEVLNEYIDSVRIESIPTINVKRAIENLIYEAPIVTYHREQKERIAEKDRKNASYWDWDWAEQHGFY